MKKWLVRSRYYLASLFLGIMVTFAFAPYEIFPLAFIAPAILLAIWLKHSAKAAFWLGFCFGIGMFTAGVYWVFISVHVFGGVPSWLALIITAGLIALMSLFPGTVGFCLNRFFTQHPTTKIVCAFPALWVLFEWIRSWFLTGFPWLFLGYSQTNSPLKGFAPILSVYGVSLAVLLTSALFLNASRKLKEKDYQQAYFNLFFLALIWTMGALCNYIPWTKPKGEPVSVSLVQGDIPQQIKWSPEYLQVSLERYETLTEPLWGRSKLIIWPEAAIPLPLKLAAPFIDRMDEKAARSNSTLILGIPIETVDPPNHYYNSIVALGKKRAVYTKRHLVPFGEYVPLTRWLSSLLNFMNIPTSDLVPGSLQQGPMILGGRKILASICYEIAFPELINSNDRDVSFLLTLTNDAWFGKSSAQAQHVQMAAMRAIELRRPAIVVSNDGITTIIGPNGTIEAKAPQHDTFVLEGNVQPTVGLTPWMRNGMDPILFIIIVLMFIAVRKQKAALKKTANEPQYAADNNSLAKHIQQE